MSASCYVNPKYVVAVSPVSRAEGGAAWFFDVYFTAESHLDRHALAFTDKAEAERTQAELVTTLKEHDHERDPRRTRENPRAGFGARLLGRIAR